MAWPEKSERVSKGEEGRGLEKERKSEMVSKGQNSVAWKREMGKGWPGERKGLQGKKQGDLGK